MTLKPKWTPGLMLTLLGLHGQIFAQGQTTTVAEFTAGQSAEGKTAYDRVCLQCHGRYLDDGQFAPPLRATAFNQKWGGQTVEQLFTYISTKMPPDAPGTLNARTYTAITAYILQSNGLAPGVRELPSTAATLATLRIPGTGDRRGGAGGGLTPGVPLPNGPAPNTLLDRITPVTDALLAKPPAGEWLTWRRTYDAQGYSPLKQIDRANVKNLRLAWSWSLPPGPNTATPLVHDGVLFVQGYGDIVEALDAATGDLLWHYQRPLPEGARPAVKKDIAIYGNKIYAATSDVHLLALDVKTGKLIWDKTLGDPKTGMQLTGGPLLAKGRVMIGTGGQEATSSSRSMPKPGLRPGVSGPFPCRMSLAEIPGTVSRRKKEAGHLPGSPVATIRI